MNVFFQLQDLSKCLSPIVNNKIKVPPGAEELVGRAVEHLFEKEDGEKNEWRGMVLSRAPIMTHWYYITYEKDPVLYMYQLWDDYKDGDLRVLPESGTVVRACVLKSAVEDDLTHSSSIGLILGVYLAVIQRTNTCCRQTGSRVRSQKALWANRWSMSQIMV